MSGATSSGENAHCCPGPRRARLAALNHTMGYLPDAAKLAVVTAEAKTFEVKRASDNVAVFTGTLGPASQDRG